MRLGGRRWRPWCRLGCSVFLAVVFLMPAPQPARALNADLAIGCTILGLLATPVIGYGVWRSLPQNRDHEGYFNGDWYAGGFLGAAFTPSQNLKYPDGFSLNNGVTRPTSQGPATLFGNKFDTSLVGGLKLGYFFHTIPYLGLEVESMVNNSAVGRQHLSTNRPINGATQVTVPNDMWVNWTTALHIVGRYGFLPDEAVPFGRLQPYVGLGPAFIVLYDDLDSAKNFGIDTMAGVRYMITRHIATFMEYKFNYQWDVEMEAHRFYLPDGTIGRGTAHLDFATHKIVFGLEYFW